MNVGQWGTIKSKDKKTEVNEHTCLREWIYLVESCISTPYKENMIGAHLRGFAYVWSETVVRKANPLEENSVRKGRSKPNRRNYCWWSVLLMFLWKFWFFSESNGVE